MSARKVQFTPSCDVDAGARGGRRGDRDRETPSSVGGEAETPSRFRREREAVRRVEGSAGGRSPPARAPARRVRRAKEGRQRRGRLEEEGALPGPREGWSRRCGWVRSRRPLEASVEPGVRAGVVGALGCRRGRFSSPPVATSAPGSGSGAKKSQLVKRDDDSFQSGKKVSANANANASGVPWWERKL